MSTNPPGAFSKLAVIGAGNMGSGMELAHLPEIFATEDAYEGLSTLGKQRPVFKGR